MRSHSLAPLAVNNDSFWLSCDYSDLTIGVHFNADHVHASRNHGVGTGGRCQAPMQYQKGDL
jgi:hypothetical protein